MPWTRFARLTQPWHNTPSQRIPKAPLPWPCSTSNRCPAGPAKADVLALLDAAGLDRRHVGRIELHGKQAVVEIPDGWEARLVKALDGRQFGDRRVRAWTSSPTTASPAVAGPSDEDDFLRLARLLDLESRAEAQKAADEARRLSPEEAQQTGNTLLDLVVVDEEAGLGGRYLVHLGRRGRGPLPWTRLGVGSPVVLSPQAAKAAQPHRGVVCDRDERSICAALDRLPEDLADHDAWRLDLSFDEVATPAAAGSPGAGAACPRRPLRHPPRRAAWAGGSRSSASIPRSGRWTPSLNAVQREAVQFAFSARDVGLIHGPPGTGKTTAVVEVIRQAVRRGRKVLACAPSNLAVDNIFERLLGFGERAVRLGHPARVLPELREHTLDLLVERHPDVRLARKFVKQALVLFREADRRTRAAPRLARGESFATTPSRSWPTPGGWSRRRSTASSIPPACSARLPPAWTARSSAPGVSTWP